MTWISKTNSSVTNNQQPRRRSIKNKIASTTSQYLGVVSNLSIWSPSLRSVKLKLNKICLINRILYQKDLHKTHFWQIKWHWKKRNHKRNNRGHKNRKARLDNTTEVQWCYKVIKMKNHTSCSSNKFNRNRLTMTRYRWL